MLMKEWIKNLKSRREGLFQLLSFALLGLVASAVELACFALFRWAVFGGLAEVDFSWWIFRYSAASGGLGYFLAVALSFLCGQAVNFFIQRKYTFEATNSVGKSAALYAVMVAAMWLLQMWLPTVIRERVVAALGEGAGDLAVKLLCMFAGLIIAFPMNKFVIMKKEP